MIENLLTFDTDQVREARNYFMALMSSGNQ